VDKNAAFGISGGADHPANRIVYMPHGGAAAIEKRYISRLFSLNAWAHSGKKRHIASQFEANLGPIKFDRSPLMPKPIVCIRILFVRCSLKLKRKSAQRL
jgi:hypothetical protein